MSNLYAVTKRQQAIRTTSARDVFAAAQKAVTA
jgi:hypothetical protein